MNFSWPSRKDLAQDESPFIVYSHAPQRIGEDFKFEEEQVPDNIVAEFRTMGRAVRNVFPDPEDVPPDLAQEMVSRGEMILGTRGVEQALAQGYWGDSKKKGFWDREEEGE